MRFEDVKFNNLLSEYYRLKRAHPYDSEVWRSNGECARRCKGILAGLAEQVDALIQDHRLLDEPFRIQHAKGAAFFPMNPWIGVFCDGETPTDGIYPVLDLRNDEDFIFVGCVGSFTNDKSSQMEGFTDLQRCFSREQQLKMVETGLASDKRIAMPAAVFDRGSFISEPELADAFENAIRIRREIRQRHPRHGQSSDLGTQEASQMTKTLSERIREAFSSLEGARQKQEDFLAKQRVSTEKMDQLQLELATLRHKLEEAQGEVEKGRKYVSSEISAITHDALDRAKQEVSNFLQTRNTVCDDVEKKFRDILQRATVGTLSEEFEKKMSLEIDKLKMSRLLFYSSLGLFAILGLVMALINFMTVSTEVFEKFGAWAYLRNLPRISMFFIPVYLPLIWFACHVNKLMHQARRLSEEYAHRTVVAKTYVGLAGQVEDLVKKGVESAKSLNVDLLSRTISVLCENPNFVLDKVRTETPVSVVADAAAKLITATKNIS